MTLTIEQAEDLTARTLAAIRPRRGADHMIDRRRDVDRERVASDLAGLLDTYRVMRHNAGDEWSPEWDVTSMAEYLAVARIKDCSAGLLRTAALYGERPCLS